MSFIPQMGEIYTGNIFKDSIKKIFILNKLKHSIVRPNGAIRYKDDRYLNLDYHKIQDKAADNKKMHEAQWFLVSEISAAYGKVLEELLKYAQKTGKPNPVVKKLISLALKGETEYINRSYARITPKNMTKSNGYSCPAYKVPEAYEAVTLKNGKVKYVPGAHPLTWAESSLYKSSELYLQNLQRLSNLK